MRAPLPEVKLWQRRSMEAFLSAGHASSYIELVRLAGHCTCCWRRRRYAIDEFIVTSLILNKYSASLNRVGKYFTGTSLPPLVDLCNLFSLLLRKYKSKSSFKYSFVSNLSRSDRSNSTSSATSMTCELQSSLGVY